MGRGKEFLERIARGEILVADGAMGTMLMSHGLKSGEPPESLNLTKSSVLELVAREYLDAGADIIQTNTFGGSPLKLSLYNLDDRTEEINRNAVQAVRRVVRDAAYVSGSCGPSGKLIKPYGDTESDTMYRSFKRQIASLVEAGVDIICVETMTDLTEATLAVRAAKQIDAGVPVMATMTFDPTPKGFYTIMGISIERAILGLEDAGADIIGSNCGNGIEHMIKIARQFKLHSRLPVIIQSNAGIPEMKGNKTIYPETPEFMAEKAKELAQIGVSIIGGCCGTTPEHIKRICDAVKGNENTPGNST
jgi:5-methyltetrahydrofolate--homocysteine methyltransferase